jgi:D-aspartate ligase
MNTNIKVKGFNNPIIVYNTSYNGLSIMQDLGSRGIKCYALDKTLSIGAFTKYAKYKKCPDPYIHETKFVDYLYKLCASLPDKPVLFPTNDHWALVTAKNKAKLSEVSHPCIGSFEVVDTMLSKDKFYKIGQENGYMTPYTWPLESLDKIDDGQFPIIAKPKFKEPPSGLYDPLIKKKLKKYRLFVINNKDELGVFTDNHKDILNFLIFQEYVHGLSDTMFTVGIYANSEYEIKGLFTGRKVRGYPANIGDNILGESHDIPDHLIENTKRVVKELGYEGIAEFEYKLNSKTGDFKLIEVNPRPWSWIGITPYCNVNLPLIAYNSLLGKEEAFQRSTVATGEVKYVKIFQDLFNSMIRYRFNYKPWNTTYRSWKKSLESKKLIIAEIHKKDWCVFIASIPYLFGKIIFQKWSSK